MSYGEIISEYEGERPRYEALVACVEEKLRKALKRAGYPGEVKGRTKDPTSFATKALLRGYANPLADIRDMAGVRITLAYQDDVEPVTSLVRATLTVVRCESKLDALAFNEFGYLGVHCDARLRDEDAVDETAVFAGLPVEVQIRTMAQSAWADVSHEKLYKPAAGVPDDLKRQIHRLVALVEVFDSEVSRFTALANATPGYREAEALRPLAGLMLSRFDVRRPPDRALSLVMAAAVVPLYGSEPATLFEQVMAAWIDEHEEALRIQFEEAQALPANPLFLQPESFLIFERLASDQARLRDAWPDTIPSAWYDEIAEAWGQGGARHD